MPAISSVQTPDQHIQFLITANYQRMLSYEQAAFLTSEPGFKEFYTARADESEANIKQLYLLLNINQSDDVSCGGEAAFANLFHGKKTTIKILASIKTVEQTIIKWYKNILKEIKYLPGEIVFLVQEQYCGLTSTQLTLAQL